MKKEALWIGLLLLFSISVFAQVMETSTLVSVDLQGSTSGGSSSGGSSGGSGSCSSVWNDCSFSECVNDRFVQTCRDTNCGRGNLTEVLVCESDDFELLPPLPPPYRRNNTAVEEPIDEQVIVPFEIVDDVVDYEQSDGLAEEFNITDSSWWTKFKDWFKSSNESLYGADVPPLPEEEGFNWLLAFLVLLIVLLILFIVYLRKKRLDTETENIEVVEVQSDLSDVPNLPQEYHSAYFYMKNALAQGYTGEALVEAFKRKGWDESQIDIVFCELRNKGVYK